jgi:acyl carrier protein
MDIHKATPLSSMQRGEVVVRGPSVMEGYADNPEANAQAFVGGWFRTGDQGYLDDEGHLFLTARIKEIINRAGEKISPREVDEVLLEHPSVIQAVTFAMPDKRLGEEVAAAVILGEEKISEVELRKYASLRLAHFKLPKRILIVDEIPKGPTGKLQRIGLSVKLGLEESVPQDRASYLAPRTPIEEALAQTWLDVLSIAKVGVHDRFLEVGGDSLLATQLISRLRDKLNIEISLMDFFDAPTIADQAAIVEELLLQDLEDEG